MKITNNIKMILLIILGIIVLYVFDLKNSDFNLNRSISACMVAQKKISESIDPDKAREFCKEEIKKKIDY